MYRNITLTFILLKSASVIPGDMAIPQFRCFPEGLCHMEPDRKSDTGTVNTILSFKK